MEWSFLLFFYFRMEQHGEEPQKDESPEAHEAQLLEESVEHVVY